MVNWLLDTFSRCQIPFLAPGWLLSSGYCRWIPLFAAGYIYLLPDTFTCCCIP